MNQEQKEVLHHLLTGNPDIVNSNNVDEALEKAIKGETSEEFERFFNARVKSFPSCSLGGWPFFKKTCVVLWQDFKGLIKYCRSR